MSLALVIGATGRPGGATVTGVPTRLVPLPIEERLFEWFAESGHQADPARLRADFPGLLTFRDWRGGRARRAIA
ncbi:hypothetical protein [Nonomuraea sp. PA05]|uniref:hypothetical protein n=1 Tax=Nonomuraea sp. PA05 TaxID=2604466 RepID=UPI0016524E68|nr:hypothetical protein [Nonomuraea sp. PA05]